MNRKDIGTKIICIKTPRNGVKKGIIKGNLYELLDVDSDFVLVKSNLINKAVFFRKKWFEKVANHE